jgi:hypothetical protein
VSALSERKVDAMKDEILAEIHAIKDTNARKYRSGFAAMMRDLRQRQEQSGRRIIRLKRMRAETGRQKGE